jgi:3-oxoacyl-[acyl-carrier-protein] synthase II
MEGKGRRVVVTGIGVVAPCGLGKQAYWEGLLRPITERGATRGVENWDPSPWFASPKEARRADRFTQFAVAAATMAIEDAGGGPPGDPARKGVIVATGIGGLHTLEEQIHTRLEKGVRRVSPFLVPQMMANAGGASISMRFGWQGPCETIVTACAASTHAIGYAARLISWGMADAIVTGGSEAAAVEIAIASFGNMTALTTSGRSMPFAPERDGFVLGEGAGVVVVESLEHALARGATPIAEILGGALTADAFHISAPDPSGRGQARAMTNAMRNAGVAPDEVDWIVAHGTSTSLNDATETRAIKTEYGSAASSRAISSPKSMIGHLVGAAGIASALAAIGAIRDQVIPPTANLHTPDPECDLDYTPLVARKAKVETVAVNGFGFGGQNAVTIFRAIS